MNFYLKLKTLILFLALALPTLAADTTIVGKVVGVHDSDTLTYAPKMKH